GRVSKEPRMKRGTVAVLWGACIFVNPFVTMAQMRQEPPVPQAHTITVSGEAQGNVQPDQALLRVGVTKRDLDIAQARKLNDLLVNKILSAARARGVESKYVQTGYLGGYQDTSYTTTSSASGSFIMYRSLSIDVRDLTRFETILTDVLAAG